jgi:hypothetical protein
MIYALFYTLIAAGLALGIYGVVDAIRSFEGNR